MEFVSFVPDYWHGPRHNRHYFCLELAKHHLVLFVSPPASIERLLTKEKRRALPASGTEQVAARLWTHVPSRLLFTNLRYRWLDGLFRRIRVRQLKRKMRELGFRNPILLVWHPQYLEMLDAFDRCLVIYYIYDHLSGYAGSDPTARSARELELLRRAHMVFVLSRKLLEENQAYNANIHLLPNAVDFEHFSKARDPATEIPDELDAIPRPRIGYIGSINEKVDVGVLETLSERQPRWSIVLIGRQNFSSAAEQNRFAKLASRPNVHWIPYRCPDVLPAYLKGLDVCLMCYVINGWTYFGDPSKMHEYLAAGKPTVGSPLPSILEFSEVIEISRTHDEWLDAVARAIGPEDPAAVERRITVARQNSYPARIRKALALVYARLGSNRPASPAEEQLHGSPNA